MKPNRVEALGDGVFAIAMTLLVIEIHVPEVAAPSTASLLAALGHLAPHIAAFAVSFLVLGTFWVGHHYQFARIQRVNRTLLWINVAFLLCIAFLPFSTAFLATYLRQPVALLVYGANLLLAGAFLYWHWRHATANRRLVAPDLSDAAILAIRRRVEAGIAVYGVATVLAVLLPVAGLALFALMPAAYMFTGTGD